jgi:hypothetical protein
VKTREDFVTNSSSSSFIIRKTDLTEKQIQTIYDHEGFACAMDVWDISEDEETIFGQTSMDNFDMHEYFKKNGIPYWRVGWGEGERPPLPECSDVDEETIMLMDAMVPEQRLKIFKRYCVHCGETKSKCGC